MNESCEWRYCATFPLGHHHLEQRKHAKKIHIMNYFHIGEEDFIRTEYIRDIFIFGDIIEYGFLENNLE